MLSSSFYEITKYKTQTYIRARPDTHTLHTHLYMTAKSNFSVAVHEHQNVKVKLFRQYFLKTERQIHHVSYINEIPEI